MNRRDLSVLLCLSLFALLVLPLQAKAGEKRDDRKTVECGVVIDTPGTYRLSGDLSLPPRFSTTSLL